MSDPVLVLREALAKATEAPWEVCGPPDQHAGVPSFWHIVRDLPPFDIPYSRADAELIVAARNLLPVLLDEVEALRKVVQDVRAAAEGWRSVWGRCCEVHSAATDAYNEAADEIARLLAVLDKEEEK